MEILSTYRMHTLNSAYRVPYVNSDLQLVTWTIFFIIIFLVYVGMLQKVLFVIPYLYVFVYKLITLSKLSKIVLFIVKNKVKKNGRILLAIPDYNLFFCYTLVYCGVLKKIVNSSFKDIVNRYK